jgi:ligand-binding sensor domain-containing protein/signal transduction histidine kinase
MKLVAVALTYMLVVIPGVAAAQQPPYIPFTVANGLPSNNVYRCLEDDKGFLWVATDEGVARFDGKYFQVFTTEHGLPDNEVLSMVKEKNGRIWINCFRQRPAYFDEEQNRFIGVPLDSNLAKVVGTNMMFLYATQNGGVMYFSEKASFTFRKGRLNPYLHEKARTRFIIREFEDGSRLEFTQSRTISPSGHFDAKVIHVLGDRVFDSLNIKVDPAYDIMPAINENNFYIFSGVKKKIIIFRNLSVYPFRASIDSVEVKEPFYTFAFDRKSIYTLTSSKKIYTYDKEYLHQKRVISGDYLPNSYFQDSKGNSWISTVDKGLLLEKSKQFPSLQLPNDFSRTHFLSIAIKPNGNILAGNHYGEVIEYSSQSFIVHPVVSKTTSRQRKIIITGNKVFTFADDIICVNFSEPLIVPGKSHFGSKTAIQLNDSVILNGNSGGLSSFHTNKKIITRLEFHKRITAMTKATGDNIYIGSTDGLHRFNVNTRQTMSLGEQSHLLNQRVTALTTTSDSLTWIGTSGKGAIVIKNDKVLLNLTTSDGLASNSVRCMSFGMPGQVWVGTAEGITIIRYKTADTSVIFSTQSISIDDGLASNIINEMTHHRDTFYIATSNGISVIPANLSIPKSSISVYLIKARINQRDTIISNEYDLHHTQRNISLSFAGVDLTGHFRNFQYKLNDNLGWTRLNGNTLNLELDHGDHHLHVRAVDVNGNASKKILQINLSIATPFWKSLWFWILVAIILQIITTLIIIRWQRRRRKFKLQKEIAAVEIASLQQQAFTSLLNPHFMFNALNSIQHYINVQDRQSANRYLSDFASLIRKNFEAAQLSFIPLEHELENIKIYLQLEQMRFSNRFNYTIHLEENIDPEDWMIPSMMLQPILENALLHGIMPSNTTGHLLIKFETIENNLYISIIDNGIGLENSHFLKKGNGHKSLGMTLIRKRITALNQFVSDPIIFQMEPAYTSRTNPGNKTILAIPYQLYTLWVAAQ